MNNFKKFMIIWLGELFSAIGSGMSIFALTLYFTKITNSASYAGLITLAGFAPMILLSPFGGVLADRYNRRVLMMLGNLFSLLGISLIFFGFSFSWAFIFIGLAIIGASNALLEPAYRATISDLLTEDEFAKASGLMQLANSSKFLFSPILAGILYTLVSVSGILIIDFITFSITIIMTFLITQTLPKTEHKEHDPFFKSMHDGYSIIKENKGIVALLLIFTFVSFLIGFIEVLFTPMLLPYMNERMIGFLIFGAATGIIIGSSIISGIKLKTAQQTILTWSLAGVGLMYALIGLSVNFLFLLIISWLFFFCLSFVNMSAEVLIRTNIDNELQGRAWGFISFISQFSMIFAYISAGLLSDYILNPLLQNNGLLASSIGKIIGTGPSRGIGLLFIIAGIGIIFLAFIFKNSKALKSL